MEALDCDPESCLPLSLQHLSFIVLLNDTTSYSVELLASLPRWLRRCLLENLSALDVCLLDGTAVAKDIDMEIIWKFRYMHVQSNCYCSSGRRKCPFTSMCHENMSIFGTHEPQLATVMDNPGTWRERFLLTITQYVLRFGALSHAALWLLAINGQHLLQNLAILDEESGDEMLMQKVFMKQAHALSTFREDTFLLIPQRYMTIQSDASLPELLSLLTHSCGLQPAYLHLDRILSGASSSLHANNGLKHLMGRLVMLKLSKIQRSILRQVFEAVVGDGRECQLLGLGLSDFCVHKEEFECLSPYLLTLPSDCSPPHYQGLTVLQLCHALHPSSLPYLTALLQQQLSLKVLVIHGFFPWPVESQTTNILSVLSSLFSRPAFQSLSLRWPNISTAQTIQIVRGFMTSHCWHTQELLIAQPSNPATTLASLDANVVEQTVSDCGVEHKVIQATDSLLHAILPLQTIRLQELELDCGKNQQHFAAIHPDLRVSKLKLKFFMNHPGLSSLTNDIKTLFGMTTLKEVTLEGPWTEITEIKKGLVLGLQQQSRVGSLRKLSLLTNSDSAYTQQELKQLWDSVFSLKSLNQLEVVIGQGLSSQVKESTDIIHVSWCQYATGNKLKSINICAHVGKLVSNCIFNPMH